MGTMKRIATIAGVAVIVAVLLLLAGCGGDDDGSSGAMPTPGEPFVLGTNRLGDPDFRLQ